MTAQYMHNGMFKTPEEELRFYKNPERSFPQQINKTSSFFKPLNLTGSEQTYTITFLKALTDKAYTKK